MTNETCGTSRPRDQTSVEINTRLKNKLIKEKLCEFDIILDKPCMI